MRNAFSPAEDERLVEYIAKNNPTMTGRLGKTLYQHLAGNTWAQSHPWQSWRERYKKNVDVFDRKIARYLKESKVSSSPHPAGRAIPLRAPPLLKEGPSRDTSPHPAGRAIVRSPPLLKEGPFRSTSPHPAGRAIPLKAPPLKEGPSRGTSPHPAGRAILRAPPLRNESPFCSTSPHPAGRAIPLRAPPLLKEGPFRNTYVPSRRKIEDDDMPWPPKRRKMNEEQSEKTRLAFKDTGSLEKTRSALETLRDKLSKMGKKYGFSTEVVENTFRATGSLERSHELLRELNRVMRGAQQALFDQMPHLRRTGEEDDEDEDEDQLILDSISQGADVGRVEEEVDHLADEDDQHSVGDADDDEQNEYKKLALEVTLQDQEAMLSFERATDGALLQQWSLALIEERLAAAREVQDTRIRQEGQKAAMRKPS